MYAGGRPLGTSKSSNHFSVVSEAKSGRAYGLAKCIEHKLLPENEIKKLLTKLISKPANIDNDDSESFTRFTVEPLMAIGVALLNPWLVDMSLRFDPSSALIGEISPAKELGIKLLRFVCNLVLDSAIPLKDTTNIRPLTDFCRALSKLEMRGYQFNIDESKDNVDEDHLSLPRFKLNLSKLATREHQFDVDESEDNVDEGHLLLARFYKLKMYVPSVQGDDRILRQCEHYSKVNNPKHFDVVSTFFDSVIESTVKVKTKISLLGTALSLYGKLLKNIYTRDDWRKSPQLVVISDNFERIHRQIKEFELARLLTLEQRLAWSRVLLEYVFDYLRQLSWTGDYDQRYPKHAHKLLLDLPCEILKNDLYMAYIFYDSTDMNGGNFHLDRFFQGRMSIIDKLKAVDEFNSWRSERPACFRSRDLEQALSGRLRHLTSSSPVATATAPAATGSPSRYQPGGYAWVKFERPLVTHRADSKTSAKPLEPGTTRIISNRRLA